MGLFGMRITGKVEDLKGLPIPEGVELKQDGEYIKIRLRTDDRDKGLMTMHGLGAAIADRLGIEPPKKRK